MKYTKFIEIQEAITSDGDFVFRVIPQDEKKNSSEDTYFSDLNPGTYTILLSADRLYCSPRSFKSFHRSLFNKTPYKNFNFDEMVKTLKIIPLTAIKKQGFDKFSINPTYQTAIPPDYSHILNTMKPEKFKMNFIRTFFDNDFSFKLFKELAEKIIIPKK